ncbi:D-amino acid dehydrogenase, small subunit [Vibrio sinaloensis DSM 21326]|uniref:D-amino acid dehydrogenase, small subunit n=1 Tax=Vibrio sinaloensis DSM 21326 TaxID=945550 RepID=E8MAC1_PHOS4|nr:FAD-dependent oxidoreductase [Vibrio sinaloensis]EGA69070.1 D-amino acid dehydrogenase, small subunit [Vibrio sinaloensis DSM 21326]
MVKHQPNSGQKIAVIGGGIIGLSIALKLQLSGEHVTVIDKKGAGEGCSKGNAGHFATEQVFPLATPGLLPQLPKMMLSPSSPVSIRFQDIHKTFFWMFRFLAKARPSATQHATRALTDLNQQAMSSWYQLLDSVGLSHLIVMDGSLLTFESDRLFKAYGETLLALESQGVRYEIWGQKVIRERVPNLAESVKHGVFFPETGHSLNPYRMCLELKSEFERLGGNWCEEEIENIDASYRSVRLSTLKSTFDFDSVVVATGAESATLVKKLTGVKVPLQAERGYHLMVPDLANKLPFPISSADRKFIMTPMSHGLRLAGTVEYAGLDSPANMKRAEMLKSLAKGLLNEQCDVEKSGERWMGNRPSLPDSLPVIDRLSEGKVLLAFGHQHLGLTQAAVTADLIYQLHTKQKTSLDVAPFSLSRFG